MNKSYYRKLFFYFSLLFLISVGLTACVQMGNPSVSNDESLYSELEEVESIAKDKLEDQESIANDKLEEQENIDNNELKEANENINMDKMVNLRESIIRNVLKVDKRDNELIVTGEYDLDKDGKNDSIEAKLIYWEESILRINNTELLASYDCPFNAYLVDLVKDDNFIEIVIYDDGPSADPKSNFYRYDGSNIYHLGTFETDIDTEDTIYSFYGNVLTDEIGNFLPPHCVAKFVTPNIVKGYYSIENNEFVYHTIDYKKYLADEYSIAEDFNAFFIAQDIDKDLDTDALLLTWDSEELKEFKKGEKIKIIVIGDYWYGVERQDGTRGILYFGIGD